ncbi:lactonase family protein [Pendulispora rubella]|uniref:Lactonase family protein n=1 Tax=Pendulispora rubella TaxID=2741070 RepID=A0ABZ2L660_9BACT
MSDDRSLGVRGLVKRRAFAGALTAVLFGGALLGCKSSSSLAAAEGSAQTTAQTKAVGGAGVIFIGSYGEPNGLTLATPSKTGEVANGALAVAGQGPNLPKASFLVQSKDRKFLYATNETEPGEGKVSAVDISDPSQPKVLNAQSSRGTLPCHVALDPSGRYLLTANYGDGAVTVHRIQPDGRIGESTDMVKQTGTTREAHAHQIVFDPSGKWILSVDLGADAVFVYQLDASTGKLSKQGQVSLPVKTGPRHLAFHPSGKYAYILGELTPVVTVGTWDASRGSLQLGQTVNSVAKNDPPNYPGEIAVSSDGKFVYASNRGENSIATFAVQDAGARLEFLGTVTSGGIWPRHFTFSPDERWMYISNQRSGKVSWLPRDPSTGRLGAPAGSIDVPTAAIVLFH